MGPLVFTGLAAFGATVAIALVASSSSRHAAIPTDPRAPSGRRTAIIAIAFCQGVAVLGAVAGLLFVMMSGTRDATEKLLAAGLPILGAAIGFAILGKNAGDADRTVVLQGAFSIGGTTILGIVVVVLATVIVPTGHVPEGPFAILGLVAALSVVAQGIVGGRAVRSIDGADPSKGRTLTTQWITQAALIEGLGVLAAFAAIFLIVTG